MDFQIATSALVGALANVADIAGDKKSTMPILGCVLLKAEQTPEGGRLTITAYDLEVGLSTAHSCEIKKPGEIALPAKALLDIAKVLPSPVTRLKLVASNRVEITSDSASFRLAGMSATDFPALPEVTDADYQPTSCLQGALDKVAFAMSSDETRYNLNGVFLDLPTGNAAATDGHRMALATIEPMEAEAGIIVSRKTVNKLRKLMAGEGANHGEFAVHQSSLLYRRQGLTMTARLVDGSFPAYQQVMPEKSKAPIAVKCAALAACLERVLLMGDRASAVKLQVEDGAMRLSARQAEIGEATDSVLVDSGSKNLTVHLNGYFLLDYLKNTEAADALMHFGDETSPILVESKGSGPTYVLMPMRG